jgi:hypothetical protein
MRGGSDEAEASNVAMIGRLIRFARTPQGRRLISAAQKAAQDPKNRERLLQAKARLEKRRER